MNDYLSFALKTVIEEQFNNTSRIIADLMVAFEQDILENIDGEDDGTKDAVIAVHDNILANLDRILLRHRGTLIKEIIDALDISNVSE